MTMTAHMAQYVVPSGDEHKRFTQPKAALEEDRQAPAGKAGVLLGIATAPALPDAVVTEGAKKAAPPPPNSMPARQQRNGNLDYAVHRSLSLLGLVLFM
jgi:hypothetical protein